jgi:GNAT superfamily N-acetyltransferase
MSTIRRAELRDLTMLAALHEEVHRLHVQARPDQFQTAPDGVLEQRFREWIAASDTKVWVAEIDGHVVGYAVQMRRHREPHPIARQRTWWEIDNLGVTATHRGRGIGTALIQAIIEDARQTGIPDVELASWAFNTAAHRAFERAGFVPKHIRFELKRS